MNNKLFLRRVSAWILFYGGITGFLSRTSQSGGIILAYHRVLPKESRQLRWMQPGMYVTEDAFEKQMRYLASNYRVVHLDELKGMRDLKGVCVITFDDGWADNFTYAYPVLKRYGLPATIFVTTGLIGTSLWHWPDRVSYYVHHMDTGRFLELFDVVRSAVGENWIYFPSGFHDRHDLAGKLIGLMKSLDHGKLQLVMDILDRNMERLKAELQAQRPWLNWEEVKKMSDCVSFGSHTHSHKILTSVPIEKVHDELEISQRVLSEQIGKSIDSFCYPNGNYDYGIITELRNAGFEFAVTTQKGTIKGSKSFLELNRLMIHEDMTNTIPLFICKLANRLSFF